MVEIIGLYIVDENPDVSLIELSVQKNWREVDFGFTQEIENVDRSNWQAPFGEVYLNEYGTEIIGDGFIKPGNNSNTTRLTFFMYYVDAGKPLVTPWGKCKFPPKSIQPDRVRRQIKFEDPE